MQLKGLTIETFFGKIKNFFDWNYENFYETSFI